MSQLEIIRRECAAISNLAQDDPLRAVLTASYLFDRVSADDGCTVAEIYGVRGSAFRKLGRHQEADQDFTSALSTCRCEECFPRIRRRQASLRLYELRGQDSLRLANEALEGFQRIFDPIGGGRTLSVRAAAHWLLGDLGSALQDARKAKKMLPASDGAFYISNLQIYACILTYSGSREDWSEALGLLREADVHLRSLNGGNFRILKLKLRWVKILAELQTGEGRNHAKRLHNVFRELLGLGLKVPRHQAEREIERARSAILEDPLSLVGVAADMSLAGGRSAWIGWACRTAQSYFPAEAAITKDLAALRRAAKSGKNVRSVALAVREHCPSAPALPPCLRAA